MAISYTCHGPSVVREASNHAQPALYKATGARVDVANAAVSSALTETGWYRIVASTTSYVLISSSATNGTGGEHIPAGGEIVRWIYAGDKIGCSAGA